MTNFEEAWLDLYDAQTEAVGSALMAMINGVTGKMIATTNTLDQVFAPGGLAEAGGFTLQMLASGFLDEPPKGAQVIALDRSDLTVIGVNNNNGILYIDVGDFVAKEGQ